MAAPACTSFRRPWWRRALGVLTLCLAAHSAATEVEVVVGDRSGVYAETADAIAARLSGQASIRVVTVAQLEQAGGRGGGAAVITLGSRALQVELAATRAIPVVATLLPRAAFEQAMRASSRITRQVSAVFLDQPYSRQLNLVRILVPERTRVGVLFGPQSEPAQRELQTIARDRKMTLLSERVADPSDLASAVARLLPESEVLLALPDSGIFNAYTLPNILLSAYRQNQPLFGFSAAYVRAGALAAVYSTPSQLAQQAADAVGRVIAGGRLPSPRHPDHFTLTINTTVARSLNLALEEEGAVIKALKRLEREP